MGAIESSFGILDNLIKGGLASVGAASTVLSPVYSMVGPQVGIKELRKTFMGCLRQFHRNCIDF
jgi:hypothetical protein